MPLILFHCMGPQILLQKQDLIWELTQAISSKTELGWRSYGSSKFQPFIQNVLFHHYGRLGVKHYGTLGEFWDFCDVSREFIGSSLGTCWVEQHMRDKYYALIPMVACICHMGIQRHELAGDLNDGSAQSALLVETINQK